jgi:hypothetical protein
VLSSLPLRGGSRACVESGTGITRHRPADLLRAGLAVSSQKPMAQRTLTSVRLKRPVRRPERFRDSAKRLGSATAGSIRGTAAVASHRSRVPRKRSRGSALAPRVVGLVGGRRHPECRLVAAARAHSRLASRLRAAPVQARSWLTQATPSLAWTAPWLRDRPDCRCPRSLGKRGGAGFVAAAHRLPDARRPSAGLRWKR